MMIILCFFRPFQLRITTILLQAYSECQLPGDVEGTVETCVGVTNCWVVYRIARQATRFGHYSLATKLFISLNNRVGSASVATSVLLSLTVASAKGKNGTISSWQKWLCLGQLLGHQWQAAMLD